MRSARNLTTLLTLGAFACLSQATPVQLSQLLDRALQHHPSIIQAKNLANAASFDLKTANWGRFPSISSELRSDASLAQSIAKVEQPLWAGGRIEGRVSAAQAELLVSQARIEDAQLNALTQVSLAYVDALRLNERLQFSKENIDKHQELFDLISRRIQAQISPPADVTLAQARLQQATTEKLQLKRQLDVTINNIAQWVGDFDGELANPNFIKYKRNTDIQNLISLAQNHSGQRKKLLAQIDSAQAQISLAKAQGMPLVVAGYQRVLSGPLASGADRGHTYVGIQFQPGSGLSALSGIASAVSKKEAAEQDLQVFDRNLQTQIKILNNDIDALNAQVPSALALREGAADLVDSYLRQYQIGRKNWLDVLNALREKGQAEANATDLKFQLSQAQLNLQILTGDIRPNYYPMIHE